VRKPPTPGTGVNPPFYLKLINGNFRSSVPFPKSGSMNRRMQRKKLKSSAKKTLMYLYEKLMHSAHLDFLLILFIAL